MNYPPGSTPDPGQNPGSVPYSGPAASGSNPLPDPQAVPPRPGYVPVPDPNPSLAASVLLGLIPGVGAMYNGQYAKALAHVVVFALLISMADNINPIFGLFIAAWVAYMVFDSYHTARARRDGTPLPNAFGLNDIGEWFQPHGSRGRRAPYTPYAAGFAAPPPPPAAGYYPPREGAPYGGNPVSGANPVPPGQPYAPGSAPPYAPAYPAEPLVPVRRAPTAAIVLIGLGVLFLLGTFGILSDRWLAHGWPLLLIGLGILLLVKRLQPPGGTQ